MGLFTNWLESLSYEIEITERCLRKVSPFSKCSYCAEACPKAAITFDDGKIVIEEKTCDTCGRCVTVCPVQAVKGRAPERKVVQQTVIVDRLPLPTKNELLYLYHKGIHTIDTKLSDDNRKEQLLTVIAEANNVLESMNFDSYKIGSPVQEEAAGLPATYTRRDFFTKISADSKKTVLSTVTPANWRYNEGCFKLSTYFPGWAVFQIDLNKEACSLCEVCFRICPANVFTLEEGILKIDEQQCSGCQLCSEVCQKNAILIEERPHQHTLKTEQVFQKECNTCGSSFYAWNDENDCFVCNSRKKNSLLSFL